LSLVFDVVVVPVSLSPCGEDCLTLSLFISVHSSLCVRQRKKRDEKKTDKE
jgi:hypothetical protein